MSLTEYQKKWNEYVNSLYVNLKYEYHKEHPKYLVNNDSSFSDWFHIRRTAKNEG